MYKYLLSAFVLLNILSCDGSSSNEVMEIFETVEIQEAVEVLKAPLREHGYSNFNTTVIGGNPAFNRFLTQVKQQESWNHKSDFLGMLENTDIDFDVYNLMLYRHTENSGSIGVSVSEPSTLVDRVSFNVSRSVPSVGTDDIAYYAFIYKVKKSIKTVEFSFGGDKKSTIIANRIGENIAPLNCKAWFDGCNECVRAEDGLADCDTAFCKVYDILNCHTWDS